ncbi:PerC family transcriptional regulator [Escherichia coli]|nr:PerC family transcriptional regulator [Escherichia coli]EKY6647271.1 PerC family transcriptional regulator [Escherichia coli]ELO3113695.1 PerC family transcriptional regulator [Escherichia coli]ELO5043371.1 PerC family transcriptional regulator [Escherichia coli]ELO5138832.1 PerC family transcriptional regulator [Escherichia coli]
MKDAIAGRLESANLWRRASARWLMLMGNSEYTEAQREWMIQRRAFCLAQIPPPASPEKIDIREISRAADKTLQQMGIACPSGEAFRSSISKKRLPVWQTPDVVIAPE